MVKRDEENAKRLLEMWSRTVMYGTSIHPRGEEVREIGDLQLTVHPEFPFQSFKERKYNLDYFKKEMIWKLGANKFDESIKAHAKMWESVQNPDGTFNSNYGQYWFGEQKGAWNVIEELVRDMDSRRAVIPMLSKDHMTPQTRDTVCTESVGFRIRDGFLFMSVHMRSSDQVFGLGTDIPTFAMLQQLVLGMLRLNYSGLTAGPITITAMSSHVYQRHYDMIGRVLKGGLSEYTSVELPQICGPEEAMALISCRGNKPANTLRHWNLTNWLFS